MQRVHEVVEGRAPSTTAICRYNQKVIPVVSYVSQLAAPPRSANVPALAQWGVHKILRMPFNSMSRKLCHSVSFCSAVDPVPLASYCKANMFRFAHSEKVYLLNLYQELMQALDADLVLSQITVHETDNIPDGGLGDVPLLQGLLDAINLKGIFADVGDFTLIPNGLQNACLSVFSVSEKVSCMKTKIQAKALVTLAPGNLSICFRTILNTSI